MKKPLSERIGAFSLINVYSVTNFSPLLVSLPERWVKTPKTQLTTPTPPKKALLFPSPEGLGVGS